MKILGIFRGFPGLGRVVSGVGLLETLRDNYSCEINAISYMQGRTYLLSRGFEDIPEISVFDYSSIGLLPTNRMGLYIHNKILSFQPDIIIIDGEPLILQSVKINFPDIKTVALLNPSDVENKHIDEFSMNYFNHLYSLSDLAIAHGLKPVKPHIKYHKFLSISTILRPQILEIKNHPSENIYCILGGGTVNVGEDFVNSTLKIASLCKKIGDSLKEYKIHIICSSSNIYKNIVLENPSKNVLIYDGISNAEDYYSDACLIITRSGRNTLSEIAYLGVPAISFISGCKYRYMEQKENLMNVLQYNIHTLPVEVSTSDFISSCKDVLKTSYKPKEFPYGNKIAVKEILKLYSI